MERYNRHIILSEVGPKGQQKLSKAKVLIVGAGGLGCPILQYLAAAGIGTLGVIDFDTVETSNLQRQILFGSSSLGQNKAKAAKEKLADLNPTISVNAYPLKLTYQNALELFEGYDIIVDGSDNFETRYLINDACILMNKPLVFGAIHKFQGQVSVFNYKKGPTYRCAFPVAPKKDTIPNCSQTGVLGVLPGIIGSMQANEVLKIILGLGQVLSGKLLCYDALSTQTTTFTVKKKEREVQKIGKSKAAFRTRCSGPHCGVNIAVVSIKDLLNRKKIQFIDVREPHEQPEVVALHPVRIPLGTLSNHLEQISKHIPKALFCQSGIRSKQAAAVLKEHNFDQVYSLKEGVSEINTYIKELQKQE